MSRLFYVSERGYLDCSNLLFVRDANENNLGLRVEDRNYNGLFVVEDKDCTKTQLMLNSDSCKDILIESNNEYTELGMGITGPL